MDKFSSRKQSSYGRQEHISYCRLWTSSEISSRGDYQEIAGYGAGYGPLQQSHQGDHHEALKKFKK